MRGNVGYRTYQFVDKDPVIDILRTLVQIDAARSGRIFGAVCRDVAVRSGVAAVTLHNWFSGPTVSPRFASAAAVARALGQDSLALGKTRPKLRVIQGGARKRA